MRAAPLVLVLLLAPSLASGASGGDVAGGARAWLAAHRNADGSFRDVAASHVAEALAAADVDPRAWDGVDLGPELDREAALLRDREVPVRTLHAWSVAGYEKPDLVTDVRASYHNGTFGPLNSPAWDSFCILALRASGIPEGDATIQATAQRLLSVRTAQGGWAPNVQPTSAADVDTTGGVLAALVAAGVDVRGDARSLLFLNSTHARTGGHAQGITIGNGANTQSTMWALHAYRLLDAAPPADDETWLLSQRQADGAFTHDPANGENGWATAEAALYFAGGRYPLVGLVPPALAPVHALEPARLALPSAYTSAHWTFPDGSSADGTTVTHVFPSAGAYGIGVDARGPHAVHRGPTDLTVLSARPVAVAPAEIETLRHVPVVLDLGASYDPDGAVRGARVDWGDGNVTTETSHAYDLPGERNATVRVVDDAGGWSDATPVHVVVRNRAPILSGLPARVVADRIHDVVLAPDATDPDGDAVWLSGIGPVRHHDLGEHPIDVVATDAFGATASARVIVDVRNLAPTLDALALPADARDGVPFAVAVRASDADGPAPAIGWRIGDRPFSGENATLALPAGTYPIAVNATDADGAIAWAFANLTVLPPDAPTPAPAPSTPPKTERHEAQPPENVALGALAFDTTPSSVVVGQDARLALVPLAEAESYRFDLGDGNVTSWSAETTVAHAWARPGAYEVRATARAADGRTSTAGAVLTVTLPPAAKPAPAAIERGSIAPTAGTAAPVARGAESGARAQTQEATRTVPAAAPLLGLLLATLGRRRGRA